MRRAGVWFLVAGFAAAVLSSTATGHATTSTIRRVTADPAGPEGAETSPAGALTVLQRDGNRVLVRSDPRRAGATAPATEAAGATAPVTEAAGATHPVTVSLLDRAGQPATGPVDAAAIDLATGDRTSIAMDSGSGTGHLPAGRYGVGAVITEPDAVTLAYLPDTVVAGATRVVLDARAGRRVRVDLDDATAGQVMANAFVLQHTQAGTVRFPLYPMSVADPATMGIYATPTGGQGGVDLRIHTTWTKRGGTDPSPYVYNLLSGTDGAIPDDPVYRVRPRDLARVQARYDAQSSVEVGSQGVFPEIDLVGANVSLSYSVPVPLPGNRVEYYTPGVPWVETFFHMASGGAEGTGEGVHTRSEYPRAGRYSAHWNSPVAGPAFPTQIRAAYVALRRPDDTLAVAVPLFGDGQPGHAGGPAGDLGITGTTTLARDGETLVSTEIPGSLGRYAAVLPADSATYRLGVDVRRDVAWSQYATAQHVTWTFRSAHGPASQRLPLLAVRFDPGADPHGRVPQGKPHAVRMWVDSNADGRRPRPDTIRLWVSYDDGERWQPATVEAGPSGDARAVVAPPRSARYVSLRATAQDQDGNGVEQTVVRAFGVTR